jgi:hypothetical protein
VGCVGVGGMGMGFKWGGGENLDWIHVIQDTVH